MDYLLIGILFVLVLGAGITYLVINATRRTSSKAGEAATADRDATGEPGIAPDHTPWLDTAQHAGEQDEQGRTVTPSDAEESGGTGTPKLGAERDPEPARGEPAPAGRVQRDPIGGEAEGRPYQSTERG